MKEELNKLEKTSIKIEEIEASDAIKLTTNGGLVFIDIRATESRKKGFIKGSIHLSHETADFWSDPGSFSHKDIFAQDNKYVLYCGAGCRSKSALNKLQMQGYKDFLHIKGGFKAWKEAGGPVELP